jgi:hypothetical protein
LQNDIYNRVSLKHKQKQKQNLEIIIAISMHMLESYTSNCTQVLRKRPGFPLHYLGTSGQVKSGLGLKETVAFDFFQ